ncbi:glycosyltransferase family 25 protein [Xenorhabdus miraniensis]|uniref:Lipooligosaccharide galactosyltransferase I n=1 Tax=Xenorhabdus miraniensis TaxID=351674 RepID=A0A2D0JLJ6_9GAMM|nr:glycosyltransferase family 25 protein [Xenorhabdus miraniensis]PHM47180.1 lipooligosaccharide galactosyltransferase I [Xenorhabdus miraniensis]
MKIFVINLEQDIDRKLSIQNQLEKVNLDAEFMTGVYGRELSDEQLKKICPDFNKIYLTLGEVGCSMSHLNVYKKIIDNNIPISLVLEDDAKLDHRLPNVLRAIESIAMSEKPIVLLLSKPNEYFDSFKKQLIDEYQIVNVIDAAFAHGYVINQAAAKKLYHFLTPIRFAADEWKLFRELGVVKLKAVVPPVIELTDMYLNSSIGNDRTDERTSLDQKHRKKPFILN